MKLIGEGEDVNEYLKYQINSNKKIDFSKWIAISLTVMIPLVGVYFSLNNSVITANLAISNLQKSEDKNQAYFDKIIALESEVKVLRDRVENLQGYVIMLHSGNPKLPQARPNTFMLEDNTKN